MSTSLDVYLTSYNFNVTEPTINSFRNAYYSQWVRHIMTSKGVNLFTRFSSLEIFRSGIHANRNERQIIEEIAGVYP